MGDLIIMNGQTQKKYRVTGFGEWVAEGRFGTWEVERFVMLQFLGQFYADGRVVKIARNPYREIGIEWFYGGRNYGLNRGYSVVVQTPPSDKWLTGQADKKARTVLRTMYEQGKISEKTFVDAIDKLRGRA